jgi:methionyl aminopeptidase
MRKAGRLVAECLDMLVDEVSPPAYRPSASTDFVYDFRDGPRRAARDARLRGYAKSTCTSINHVVCHGIPGDKPFRDGDIVNVDVTFIVDGWHGDSSRMYAVGDIPRRPSG